MDGQWRSIWCSWEYCICVSSCTNIFMGFYNKTDGICVASLALCTHIVQDRDRKQIRFTEVLCWKNYFHGKIRCWRAIMSPLSPKERTPIVIQLCLRSRIGLWIKLLRRTNEYHALFFFWCGVYKYCCLVYRTVWCEDEVWSANCARTMSFCGRELISYHNSQILDLCNFKISTCCRSSWKKLLLSLWKWNLVNVLYMEDSSKAIKCLIPCKPLELLQLSQWCLKAFPQCPTGQTNLR